VLERYCEMRSACERGIVCCPISCKNCYGRKTTWS